MRSLKFWTVAVLALSACGGNDNTTPPSSAKDITQLTISGVDGTISGTSIAVTLPAGTDVTSLTPTIAVSADATVAPASGAAQDFTNPVAYTVTAADGSTQQYTVTVTLAQQQQLLITAFVFRATDNPVLSADAVGFIGGSHVAVPVPNGTVVTNLIPTIAVSAGATVSPASGAAQSFASPVTFTVTDGVNSNPYTVSVSATNKNIILFSIDGVDGTITAGGGSQSGTVTLAMPCGTDLTSLAPLVGFTGKGVSPASGVAQDFSNSSTTPVLYTVTGADDTTKPFNVTVTAPCP
jgi:hypothetical protein